MENLLARLEHWAVRAPHKLAFILLEDGLQPAQTITFAELYTRTTAIATYLMENGLTQKPVLLLYFSGLEFIIAYLACTAAGAIAIPINPGKTEALEQTTQFLAKIIKALSINIILIEKNLISLYELHKEYSFLFQSLNLVDINRISESNPLNFKLFTPNPNSIIHILYTSGSTLASKGVVTTHDNIMHGLAATSAVWNYNVDSISLSWAAHFHIYGLVSGFLMPLFNGNTAYLFSPTTFVQNPMRWLQAISQYRITHSGAPNFAYDYCVKMIDHTQLQNCNLASWRIAINGGEIINGDTILTFTETFKAYRFNLNAFCPAYGMTEHAGLIAGKKYDAKLKFSTQDLAGLAPPESTAQYTASPFVSCGKPIAEVSLIILDPMAQQKVNPGQIGEIGIASPMVSPGYYEDHLHNIVSASHYYDKETQQWYLRTGDLGTIIDEELVITGRSKEIIIINGKNYYPADLEYTIYHAYNTNQPTASIVFAITIHDKEEIVVLHEIDIHETNYATIALAIRKAVLAKYHLTVYEVQLIHNSTLPRTASGKIQRLQCKSNYLANKLEVIYSDKSHHPKAGSVACNLLDNIQQKNRKEQYEIIYNRINLILAELLQLPLDAIGSNSRLFDLGMTSILATTFIHLLQKHMPQNLLITNTLVFEYPTTEKIASYIHNLLIQDTNNQSVGKNINNSSSKINLLMSEAEIIKLIHEELNS